MSAPDSVSIYDCDAAPSFEWYDERFTEEGFEVDIYIPIR